MTTNAIENVRGLANTWYIGLKSTDFVWNEWKEIIIAAFTDHTPMPVKLTRMLARVKTTDESMNSYFDDKATLVRQCYIEGKEAVDCIVDGINDDSLKTILKQKDYQTSEQLLIFLNNIDTPIRKPDLDEIRKRNDCTSNDSEENACLNAAFGGPQMMNTISNISTGSKIGNIWFDEAIFNDTIMQACMSEGNKFITLREKEAKRLQLKLQPTNVVLEGFDGSVIQPCGITKATIKIDLAVGEVDVFVVLDEIQDVPLIVGQTFFDLPGITMVRINGLFRIFHESLACLPELELLPLKKTSMTTENTISPLHNETDVKIEEEAEQPEV